MAHITQRKEQSHAFRVLRPVEHAQAGSHRRHRSEVDQQRGRHPQPGTGMRGRNQHRQGQPDCVHGSARPSAGNHRRLPRTPARRHKDHHQPGMQGRHPGTGRHVHRGQTQQKRHRHPMPTESLGRHTMDDRHGGRRRHHGGSELLPHIRIGGRRSDRRQVRAGDHLRLSHGSAAPADHGSGRQPRESPGRPIERGIAPLRVRARFEGRDAHRGRHRREDPPLRLRQRPAHHRRKRRANRRLRTAHRLQRHQRRQTLRRRP